MKNIVLILIIFLFASFTENDSNIKQVQIKIIDTKENLCGVQNTVSSTYSNVNGVMTVNANDSINLQMISYKNVSLRKVLNDTVIIMKDLEN